MYGRREAACLGEAYGGDRLTARNITAANDRRLASAAAAAGEEPSLTFQPGASLAGSGDPLAALAAGGGTRRGSGGLGASRGAMSSGFTLPTRESSSFETGHPGVVLLQDE